MKIAILSPPARTASKPVAIRLRSSTKRRPLLERLEDRVALSVFGSGGYSISHPPLSSHSRSSSGNAAIHPMCATNSTRTVAQQASLYAGPASYTTPVGTPLTTTQADGLINAVTNNGVPNVYINIIPTAQTKGTLQFNTFPPNTYGVFTYTPPSTTFTGRDTFSYQATNGSISSNVGTVTISVGTGTTLIPTTPYFNYLRRRRSIDPARFDYYHPRIGALLGMEAGGIPSTPTTIVALNKHFNATAARRCAENPQSYDEIQPVLGACSNSRIPPQLDATISCRKLRITSSSECSMKVIPLSTRCSTFTWVRSSRSRTSINRAERRFRQARLVPLETACNWRVRP